MERLEQALTTQDQRASAMMRTTEAVLSNELNQTSESGAREVVGGLLFHSSAG